jgi:hypothetical protein
MIEKKPAFRYLTQGEESAHSGESFGQLPVPNLEERARLFLRAVHGERDIANGEHAEAQSTILDGMAADIAAKSDSGMTEEAWERPPGPEIDFGERPGTIVAAAMGAPRFEVHQPTFAEIEDSPRQFRSAIEERQQHETAFAPQQYAARLTSSEARHSSPVRASVSMASARPTLEARMSNSLAPSPAPTHKPANRRVFVWGAALSIFAGLCVLGGLALYQMASEPTLVTARSAAGDTPEADEPSLPYQFDRIRPDDKRAAFGSEPSPAGLGVLPAPNVERSKAALIERARTVIAAGDIQSVRAALSKLVEGGHASAAVDLGSTYDPNVLDALGIRNFPADVAKARVWYQRAQQMGAPEAVGLLEGLEDIERRSR